MVSGLWIRFQGAQFAPCFLTSSARQQTAQSLFLRRPWPGGEVTTLYALQVAIPVLSIPADSSTGTLFLIALAFALRCTVVLMRN
jgi:hypothetical protein